MSKKMKDTEYLFISTYLHTLENLLVSRERLERMIDAPTAAEAIRLLEECGYGDMTGVGLRELESRLARRRAEAVQDLSALVPVTEIVDVFRIKYDYHNAKALVKSESTDTDVSGILSDAGRISPPELIIAFRGEDISAIPETLAVAYEEAKETLASTGDPQLADFVLDRAYFKEMLALAESVGIEFLKGYVKLNIDSSNLRSAVRTVRMGRNTAFLHQALIAGGNISTDSIIAAVNAQEPLAPVFVGELYAAALLGDEAVTGGSLTAFERACDNAVVEYMSGARSASFGETVPIGYLFAIECEISAVRTVVSGRLAGISPDAIRERLRDLYV